MSKHVVTERLVITRPKNAPKGGMDITLKAQPIVGKMSSQCKKNICGGNCPMLGCSCKCHGGIK